MTEKNFADLDVKVWLMEMPADVMKKKTLSWKEIDRKIVSLLNDKGVRITKQSGFTPKGIFRVGGRESKSTTMLGRIRENMAAQRPGLTTEFFEMTYSYEEIRDVYNKIGGLQNTFPPYMKTKEDYEVYAKSHDIMVLEDVKTNEPVGFFSQTVYEPGSGFHQDIKESFGIETDKKIFYIDTIALDESRIGQGIGKDISDICDAYYGQILGEGHIPMLYTGEINQVKGGDLSRLKNIGKLAKEAHEKRGFKVVGETMAKAQKYIDRDTYYQEQDKEHNLSSGRRFFMRRSYTNS